MAKSKNQNQNDSERLYAPAISDEEREKQLIARATDEAEKRIRDGTASNQLLLFYLKQGSSKEKLEKDILERQKELITAKTESIKSAARSEEMYEEAKAAMLRYSGQYNDSDIQ